MATTGKVALTGSSKLLSNRRLRSIRESATAYLFLLPAFIIIGTFGLFPMVFSVYVSLHRWRILPGKYLGIDNYVKALDSLAYTGGIWLAIILIVIAIYMLINVSKESREHDDHPWPLLAPGLVTAVGMFQFIRFAVFLLPAILDIAEQVKGQVRTQALFVSLLGDAWKLPQVASSRLTMLLVLGAALIIAYAFVRWISPGPRSPQYYTRFTGMFFLLGVGLVVGWFTLNELQKAYAAAAEAGESLDLWMRVIVTSLGAFALIAMALIAKRFKIRGRAQTFVILGGLLIGGTLKLMVDAGKVGGLEIVAILIGLVLMFFSWKAWHTGTQQDSSWGLVGWVLAAILMMIGAWVLIAEVPPAIRAGDKDWWAGIQTTIYYSVTTVPAELVIGLFLATLLFQKIKAKGFFRLVYFLPYITNPVAAASVFRIIFSSRVSAPMNALLGLFGAKPLLWLNEPQGILQMLLPAADLPRWLGGPSLALFSIALYGIWTFVGYNTVVFLAGLGSVPTELYEAASIDGAGRWQQFRHITLPLLSPTTYFLTLIAVIGTFKAFSHLWVLRSNAALGTTDTASIVIFNEFNRNTRYGYASALALILLAFILVLTTINNRVAEEKVFYG